MSEIRNNIAENLYRLRLESNLTQSELAQKLNYTDKSVSKWENGDATPPIDTLKELADLYGVTLDYLTSKDPHDNISNNYSSKENNTNKIIITILAVSIVWLIATVCYVYSYILANVSIWKIFIYAVPVSLIILLVFNGIWGKRKYIFIICSLLIWSILASFYIMFLDKSPWALFIIGVPLQVGTILWANLKPNRKINQ